MTIKPFAAVILACATSIAVSQSPTNPAQTRSPQLGPSQLVPSQIAPSPTGRSGFDQLASPVTNDGFGTYSGGPRTTFPASARRGPATPSGGGFLATHQAPAGGSGAAGDMIGFSHSDGSGTQTITLVDTSKSWIAVYHIDTSGKIRLVSSRPIDADFTLELNATAPLPREIRQSAAR